MALVSPIFHVNKGIHIWSMKSAGQPCLFVYLSGRGIQRCNLAPGKQLDRSFLGKRQVFRFYLLGRLAAVIYCDSLGPASLDKVIDDGCASWVIFHFFFKQRTCLGVFISRILFFVNEQTGIVEQSEISKCLFIDLPQLARACTQSVLHYLQQMVEEASVV